MTYFKKISVILLLTFSFKASNAQTKFDNGYKDGFAKAYCYNQSIGCIPKAPTFAPIPRINESSNSYQNGYERGYAEGLEYRRKEGQSDEANLQKNTAITFNPYVSQIPSNYYNAAEFRQKLSRERIDWVSISIKNIINYIDTYIKPIDKELGENLFNENNNWVQSNLSFKKLDLTDEYVFSQVKNYFLNFNNKISSNYFRIIYEAINNSINFDDRYYQNIPEEKKGCDVNFFRNGKTVYEMKNYIYHPEKSKPLEKLELISIDENIIPTFIQKFKIDKDGKGIELTVLYFNKYDSYQFYLSDKIYQLNDDKSSKLDSVVFSKEYTQGGYGNPIFIKLSNNSYLLFDKGKRISCNFLGEVYYKMNKYHNGIFVKNYFDQKLCWQDKFSGKKYFLNSSTIDDIPVGSDNLLITSNIN